MGVAMECVGAESPDDRVPEGARQAPSGVDRLSRCYGWMAIDFAVFWPSFSSQATFTDCPGFSSVMVTFDPSGTMTFVPSSSTMNLPGASTLLILPVTSCCANATDIDSRAMATTATRVFMRCSFFEGWATIGVSIDPGWGKAAVLEPPPAAAYKACAKPTMRLLTKLDDPGRDNSCLDRQTVPRSDTPVPLPQARSLRGSVRAAHFRDRVGYPAHEYWKARDGPGANLPL